MNATKHIYVLLTDTGTLFTRMIRLYTKAPMNHASIALDGDLEQVYSFGRRSPGNPFSAGFVKENLRGELFRQATCSVYRLAVSANQYERLKRIIRRFEENKSQYSYNLLGLATLMLNVPLERENAFFCSEFVASALSRAGLRVTDKPASLVTPFDLAASPSLTLCYRGELQAYLNGQGAGTAA
ncbi:hypothetical protein [Cohnella nanjingensis]|uniref:Uncharacterized protein n=1 Tax=Cohnella nanjingensis TaxID=1387779 RepID=A0A7X0RN07_9BACL|nr:hypothetical protein [Cohnella nanjingensis]MBB6670460.1 hypothetical protein [Cohnella nanjingensis]